VFLGEKSPECKRRSLPGQHRRTKPPSSSQAGQFYSGAVGQYYCDGNIIKTGNGALPLLKQAPP
jgi:hypothetical protein